MVTKAAKHSHHEGITKYIAAVKISETLQAISHYKNDFTKVITDAFCLNDDPDISFSMT